MGPRKQAWVSWSAGALLITHMGESIVILRMLAALFSGTWITILAATTIRNQNAKHGKGKTIILHCYFRSNPSRSMYRKRMIEIWQECTSFQTTRLADQVRTIMKKRMVFWPWNTRHTPENTVARQFNYKYIKWRQPKTTYQKWTANSWKWIRHNTKKTLQKQYNKNNKQIKKT